MVATDRDYLIKWLMLKSNPLILCLPERNCLKSYVYIEPSIHNIFFGLNICLLSNFHKYL